MRDATKIETYERYRRGEITEDEARERLGDGIIDGMREDREAFRAAMERDSSKYLQKHGHG